MGYNTNPPGVSRGASGVDHRRAFVVSRHRPRAARFVLFDPVKLTKEPAFDHAKLAAALSTASGKEVRGEQAAVQRDRALGGRRIRFIQRRRARFKCDRQGSPVRGRKRAEGTRQRAARATRRLRRTRRRWPSSAITTCGCAMSPRARRRSLPPTASRITPTRSTTPGGEERPADRGVVARFEEDRHLPAGPAQRGRHVLVETKVGHPTLQAWKYPLPGDDTMAMIRRVIVDVERAKVIRLQMPPDPHRSTLCDHVACRSSEPSAAIGWTWSGVRMRASWRSFPPRATTSRRRCAWPTRRDGAVRDVMEERVATQYESGQGMANWRLLPATPTSTIWYSERSNWGHLYLVRPGHRQAQEPNHLGRLVVTELLRVDEKARTLYFLADGREKGRDPYFNHLYRVGFDGQRADAADARRTPTRGDVLALGPLFCG
jgi:dipeptidyl-peptidase 4